MSVKQAPHEWSKEALLDKAQRYAEVMLSKDKDSWEFGFWSALTLEMLARAALSSVSPTLIASSKDWEHIYFALGHQPLTQKYKAKSEDASKVFLKLQSIFPEFTAEMHNFAATHIERRNSELHSGSLPFDELKNSTWLPIFYAACAVLLGKLGEKLELLFGADEAKVGEELIAAHYDTAAKAVFGTIKQHAKKWQALAEGEREKLAKQAEFLANRKDGHRVTCPACGSVALVGGTPIAAAAISVDEDSVMEKQAMLPSHFECTACQLKIVGLSKLNAAGLADTYTATRVYEAADYFSAEDGWSRLDDDNNEY